ncbi:hypothetical protein [Tanticharoenia sakaeratensis]|uniref:Uncharacterized protein n=1 Tax=Tanticharoenia sakaeratensis NBRC 103193 TaxID=1231623 RepID=A0A0D6MN74_9PROT|nr:hypothetical protein [Tanticharoenia sakaeratensis]GAN55147.1 hypothetical protein Tasa_038_128 [Tanticharoenia sakaeratensis NBRC 103193]GBQ20349.1 hypothetical protein AA103193_1352 [Tanticharoenia sakaeratensis NBRC 103193]
MDFSVTATALGDFFTGARTDHSGLLSILNQIMGHLPAPGAPSTLEQRAEPHGLIPELRRWQAGEPGVYASESTIRTLFHPDELARFSRETGLSPPAVMDILRELVPACVRIRAKAMADRAEPHAA